MSGREGRLDLDYKRNAEHADYAADIGATGLKPIKREIERSTKQKNERKGS